MNNKKKTIDINAKIENLSYRIDVLNEVPFAIIKFDNLGYGVITDIKLKAKGYNSFGDVVLVDGKEEFLIVIQDVRIEKNSTSHEIKVPMPDKSIRNLSVEENQTRFLDGVIFTYDRANTIDLEPLVINGIHDEEIFNEFLKSEYRQTILYEPQELNCGWVCICGRLNNFASKKCTLCRSHKEEIFQPLDESYFNKRLIDYKKRTKEKMDIAKKKEASNMKSKKLRALSIFIGLLVVALLIMLSIDQHKLSKRTVFSTEAEMKKSIEGVYSYENTHHPRKQLKISGDKVTKRWVLLGSDHDLELRIKKWNPKRGMFSFLDHKIVVTSDGNILYDGELYKKGGTWESRVIGSYTATQTSLESGFSVLKLNNLSIEKGYSYIYCKGTITNTGKMTYNFVKIKGMFKDSTGRVVDTDWTYAVGSVGLSPDESKTFSVSVPIDSSIRTCSVNILSYD